MTYAEAISSGNEQNITEESKQLYLDKLKEEINKQIENAHISKGQDDFDERLAEITEEAEKKIAEEIKVDIKSTSTERANKNVVGEELENAGKAVNT